MSQYDFGTMDPNTKTGTQLAVDLNNFRDALNSLHRGVERPAYAQGGMVWVKEVSAGRWDLMLYDGFTDIRIRSINPVTHAALLIEPAEVSGLADLYVAAGELDQTAVRRDSATGAAILPAGTEAQRPAAPINSMLRYNTETDQFEGYQGGKWGAIGGGSHVLSPGWETSRDMIGDGHAATDGQLLSRATYPDAAAAIIAGKVPVVDDATWLADPTQRGKFSLGDGSTTFRLPDWNGVQAGSLGAVFQRGDGARSSGEAGLIQRDTVGPLELETHISSSSGGASLAHYPRHLSTTNNGDDGVTSKPVVFATNTGEETRSLNVTGCWVIKLFGAVVNVGSADAAQLASDYANLAGRVSALESKPGLGWGQTWQDVSANRSFGTTYTNSTDRPIAVLVRGSSNSAAGIYITVAGEQLLGGQLASGSIMTGPPVIIPAGAEYSAGVSTGTGSLNSWKELR